MLQINPKKFVPIKNKTIPNPMRPKFRNKEQANIYFLSKRKITGEKKIRLFKRIKVIAFFTIAIIVGYVLTT